MVEASTATIEEALGRTEQDADAGLKAATAVSAALKRARAAARDGNLRDLPATLAAAEQAVRALHEQVVRARAGWDFDDEDYFASGGYLRELLETAQQMGVAIHERDERLYCYPSLVRVLPSDRAVQIDKARERRVRPSVVVAHLRDRQRRPPQFRPEAFLQSLFQAYETLASAQSGRAKGARPVIRLREIYRLLTLLPGQRREYAEQEFARDLYLLDQSGEMETSRGDVLSFEASTGTKSDANVLTVVTQSGHEKKYYGITFTRDG
ncbi:MAG: hypothetical protein ACRDJE_07985 [Dehalococcoidia bacterium]